MNKNEIDDEVNDNTTFINNFNPINYYSFWLLLGIYCIN